MFWGSGSVNNKASHKITLVNERNEFFPLAFGQLRPFKQRRNHVQQLILLNYNDNQSNYNPSKLSIFITNYLSLRFQRVELLQKLLRRHSSSSYEFGHYSLIVASAFARFLVLGSKGTDVMVFHEMLKDFDLVQPQMLLYLTLLTRRKVFIVLRMSFFDGKQRLELVKLLFG